MKRNIEFISLLHKHAHPLKPLPTGVHEKLAPLKDLKAVLFDIYGTLFISSSGDFSVSGTESPLNALNILLPKYHISEHPSSVYRRFIDKIQKVHHRLSTRNITYPEVRIEKIWKSVIGVSTRTARAFALEYEALSNPVWPMHDMNETLKNLRERGVLLGIISNAQFFTPYLFEAYLGKSMKDCGFNPRLCLYSYKYSRAKPSPLLFGIAKKRLKKRGIQPNNTLYVGNDLKNDIFPAQKVGFRTALFAGDHRSLRMREDDKLLRGIKPDIIIITLASIVSLFSGDA